MEDIGFLSKRSYSKANPAKEEQCQGDGRMDPKMRPESSIFLNRGSVYKKPCKQPDDCISRNRRAKEDLPPKTTEDVIYTSKRSNFKADPRRKEQWQKGCLQTLEARYTGIPVNRRAPFGSHVDGLRKHF